MNLNNKIFLIILKVLAILGLILTFLSFGGRGYGFRRPNTNFYPIAIGICLIIPYFLHLILSKQKPKKNLGNNSKKFDKSGLTIEDYKKQKLKSDLFDIFILNETNENLIINRKSILEPDNWYIFQIDKYKPIYFSNGIEYHIDNDKNLETIDYRNQIIGLGDENFELYQVPEYVNWALVIANPNGGDTAE
jgi:hypothetical protein